MNAHVCMNVVIVIDVVNLIVVVHVVNTVEELVKDVFVVFLVVKKVGVIFVTEIIHNVNVMEIEAPTDYANVIRRKLEIIIRDMRIK